MSEQAPSRARLAIYAAPEPGDALWALGSSLLGYDAASGADLAPPRDLPCDAATWRDWTEAPRRYGFHATLKAPFRLRDETTLDALDLALSAWADRQPPVSLPRLAVRAIGSFVALVPDERSVALDGLAASCVEAFEPFRAPLNPQERERRLAASLSARQVELLDRYGYPYVMDEFRFHMTLTGSLPKDQVDPVRAWLERRYAELRPGLAIESVALFRQERAEDRFRIRRRFPLRD